MRELAARGHAVTHVHSRIPEGFSEDPALLEVMGPDVESIELDPGPVPRLHFDRGGPRAVFLARKAATELVWPDPWSLFAHRASAWARARVGEFDVVVTSALPFSDHLVGYELARVAGVPWVADLGDPYGLSWVDGEWRRNAFFPAEQEVLALASELVVTTPATAELYDERGLFPRGRTAVVPAGVEALGLGEARGDGVTLVHAGAVYGPRASVRPFVDGVRQARAAGAEVELRWFGEFERDEERAAVAEVAELRPRVPQAELRAAESDATALVVLGNHGGVQLPAKLWRAAGSGRWILGVLADDEDPLGRVEGVEGLVLVENRAEAVRDAILEMAGRAPPAAPTDQGWAERAAVLEATLRRAEPRDGARARSVRAIVAGATLTAQRPRWRALEKLGFGQR
jgi:hypothetical protein